MNLTVYLPDELGTLARNADLPLSRTLREAVQTERRRREAVAATMGKAGVYQADVAGEQGQGFTIRVHGSLTASSGTVRAFIGHDEQLFAHDSADGGTMHYLDDPAELDQLLELDAYIAAMHALGLRPVIDVGLPRADGND
jgi:hypothetical protein